VLLVCYTLFSEVKIKVGVRELRMKFLICVDLEGVAGIVGEPGKTLSNSQDFDAACTEACLEVNACAKGLFDAGAQEVWVWDNHNGSLNLPLREIDGRCLCVCGTGDPRRLSFANDSFDGALFVGYHAMEGTPNGVLAHTYSSVSYRGWRLNGRETGEIGFDAGLLGEKGIPLLFVSSDAAGVSEAKKECADIVTVETKQGLSRNMAVCRSSDSVCREMEEKMKEVSEGAKSIQPLRYEPPLCVDIEFQRMDKAEEFCRQKRRFSRTDAYTCTITIEQLSEIF
jgi:D-amino peptidase